MALTDIILRETSHSPLTTKGSTLTHAELDANIIELYEAIRDFAGSIAPYDAGTTYAANESYYVSYNNNIYHFIGTSDTTGVDPVTGLTSSPPSWEESSIGAAIAAGGGVHDVTVAQATALAAANGLVRGDKYRITNAYGGDAIIYLEAAAPSLMNPYGLGTYENANMDSGIYAWIGYDLTGDIVGTADYIFDIFDPKLNNRVRQDSGDTLSKMPLNTSLGGGYFAMENVDAVNLGGTWAATVTYIRNSVLHDCTVNTANSGAGGNCGIADADIRRGATISMTADSGAYTAFTPPTTHAYLTGYVGADATVIVTKAAIGKHIGPGRTVSTAGLAAGYEEYNGYYDGDVSTFKVSTGQCPALDPDGSGQMDLSDCKWAGVLQINNAGANPLDQLNNFETDYPHKISIFAKGGFDQVVDDAGVASGNILLKAISGSITLSAANQDYIEIRPNLDYAANGFISVVEMVRA